MQWSFASKLLITGTPLQARALPAARLVPPAALGLRAPPEHAPAPPLTPRLTPPPPQNNIRELWALLHFLEPARFPNSDAFEAEYDMRDPEKARALRCAAPRFACCGCPCLPACPTAAHATAAAGTCRWPSCTPRCAPTCCAA